MREAEFLQASGIGSSSDRADPAREARLWSASGAMELTGRSDGPALGCVGAPATVAAEAAAALGQLAGLDLDGLSLLTQRARLAGTSRNGRISVGGGTRLLAASDGWCAVNLSRESDSVAALTSKVPAGDEWEHLAEWVAGRPAAESVDRGIDLGMAVARLGETSDPTYPWRLNVVDRDARLPDVVRVVNFGALWAGPLAAGLLGLGGAHVLHVESASRRDPSRLSAPGFYAQLRHGQEVRVVDFSADNVRALLTEADVVIESSRPRAFRQLGCDAETLFADGRPRVWLRITAHEDGRRVGFGDDCAVAGGLVADDDGLPAFAGDALADPLTGLLAAVAVFTAIRERTSCVVDISLAEVSAYSAARGGAGACARQA